MDKNIEMDLSSLRQCVYCHNFCKFSCQPYLASKDQKIMQNQKNYLIYLNEKGKVDINKDFARSVYRCNDCLRCERFCLYDNKDVLQNNRYAKKVVCDKGIAPVQIYKIKKNLTEHKTIFGKQAAQREGKDIKYQTDIFIYCGDYVKHKEPGVFESFTKILDILDIQYLYDDYEISDGILALDLGMDDISAILMKENYENISRFSFKKIVTLNPYSLYGFKNDYEKNGYDFQVEVVYYIDFLNDLIKKFKVEKDDKKIKYFDPCKLSRQLSYYEPPRRLLNSLNSNTDIDFYHNREDSKCCGGYISLFDPKLSRKISLEILEEFTESKSDLLITSCPLCLYNLKEADKKHELDIRDICDYMLERIKTAV